MRVIEYALHFDTYKCSSRLSVSNPRLLYYPQIDMYAEGMFIYILLPHCSQELIVNC